MNELRVLFAPRNIAGQAELYASSLRQLGHHAEVWSFGAPAFGFGADRVVDVKRLRADAAYRWELLDDAVRGFDIFHFQYGRSLLLPDLPSFPPLADLPLLASLDKKLIMNFRGSDVRLRSVHMAREPDSYMKDPTVVCDEERILADVSVSRRYCDAMLVSTPGLLDYVPDALWFPHVVDVSFWDSGGRTERAVPRVGHLPSRRSTKSSDIVGTVCRSLEDRGLIEYVELSGLGRDEVRAAFAEIDIMVDSLAIGDHGLVSVEAMASGAIAVAHIHPRNRDRNPGVPVVEATIHDLGQVLERLASNPSERREIRERSVEWVRKNHSVERAGPLLEDLYRRPPVRPDLSDPAFPIVADSARVRELEAEVEQLRASVAQGTRRLTRRSPVRAQVERVVTAIRWRLRKLAHRSGLSRISAGVRRRASARWRR